MLSECKNQKEVETEPSTFTRKGSLRKIIPGENNSENMFLKRRGDISKIYKDIQQEYTILAEYKMVMSESIRNIYVIPSRDNFLAWFGVIFVKSGIYEGGIFRFTLLLDQDFPNTIKHPVICFQSDMFHPAVSSETNELNLAKAFSKWNKFENHIWQLLKYMKWIFERVEESLEYSQNEEAEKLFNSDKEEFMKKAKSVVAESMENLYADPLTDDKHYITFEPYDPIVHESAKADLLGSNTEQRFTSNNISQNSWVLPGNLKPLVRPATPDSEQEL